MSRWLDQWGDLIEATLPDHCRIFVLIGGSLVSGLATVGSDLDLCTALDDRETAVCLKPLENSFRQAIRRLDEDLKKLGLHLCRLSKRIRRATEYLELDRCRESKAAEMRTTVKMHYLLSSRQVLLRCGKESVRRRIGSEGELLRLKLDLWGHYKARLGRSDFPLLPLLLRRPGGYSPGRVLRQVSILTDNIILSSHRSNEVDAMRCLAKLLEEKLLLVEESGMLGRERPLTARGLQEVFRLMRSAKETSVLERDAHRRSFHYLKIHGYINGFQWQLIEEATRSLYEAWKRIS